MSEDREVSPSAAILDSQSVKTATPAAIEVGFDTAKHLTGRKRHLLVDPLGLVLMVVVTAAVRTRTGGRSHRYWRDSNSFGIGSLDWS